MITLYYTYYDPIPQKEKRSREHRLGRSLLSLGLKELYSLSIPPEEMDLHLSSNQHEKPYFTDHPHIHFNISHCEQLVACGFSDCRLGVDVEDIAPFRETIFRRVLTTTEQEFLLQFREKEDLYREYFYRFWTLKESRIKEAGMGLAMPMTDFSFEIDLSREPAAIACSLEGLYFYQKKLDAQRLIAVCCGKEIGEIAFRKVFSP